MRLLFSLAVALAFALPAARAESKDPLRFFSEQTDVVLKVEKPRALVEAVLKHDLAKDAQELQVVRELLDSANFRRFFRLVAHFEKELGAPWPELIDKIAGGGMAAGLRIVPEANAPVLLVVQGTDEKAVARFFDLGLSVLDEERARQGAPTPLPRKTYAGADCVELDKDAFVARAGDALLFSNNNQTLKAGIDQGAAAGKDPKAPSAATVAGKQAPGILPPNPTAWLWVNLKRVKELPQLKELFETPRANFILTLAGAGYLDVARRSDFVAAGLYAEGGNFRLAVRMPAGRDGMAPDVELHLPRDPAIGGTLPLLEPKGVLFSHSFYFDFDTLYQKRDKIFPPDLVKGFAEGEKQISRFLIGSSLPKFLGQSGVFYRLVAAKPEPVPGYKAQPDQRLPAFAAVLSMRDPAFAKMLTTIIKGGALAAGQAVSLEPWEEQIAGVAAFGYSFPENGKFPDDPLKLHFNYQPTFGPYKDQYILASNKGLFRELVGLLDKEDRSRPASQNMRLRAYAAGAGDYAAVGGDQSLAATIVAQAVKIGEARKQTEALFAFLQKLGTIGVETDYTANEFRFDVTWKLKK
jgi:hypothetical protein